MSLIDFLRSNARFLFAGGLLAFTSSYGQTFFISIFAAQIMATYGLSDGQWGGLYTISTTLSAVVMLWAGTLTDRFRVRTLAFVVIPALMLVCLGMSWNTQVWVLFVLIFALRFLGQGMLSQLSVVAMARWFVARRGLALSIAGLGFAVGTAAFPVLFAALLGVMDWRQLWQLAAVLLLVTLPIVAWLLSAERTPQSLAKETVAVGMDGRHWTRPEVLRSPLFWFLVPMLLGPPAWGTALYFHQVHIAEVRGWPLVEYLALIPLLILVSVIVTLASGQLIDRFGTARLIQWTLVPQIIAFSILAFAETLPVAALGLVVFGISQGLQATVPTAFWAEFYGTRYLGSIKALSNSLMVLGSAIGPGITGYLIDVGYDFPQQMLAIAVYFVLGTVCVRIGVVRVMHRLSAAGQVQVERT